MNFTSEELAARDRLVLSTALNKPDECRTCRWWGWERGHRPREEQLTCSDTDRGWCQHRSPTLALQISTNPPDLSPQFPSTLATGWCGDHEPLLKAVERETIDCDPAQKCPGCGSALKEIGPYGYPIFDCGSAKEFDGSLTVTPECRERRAEARP